MERGGESVGSLGHIFTPEIRSSAGAPAVRKSLIPNVDSYSRGRVRLAPELGSGGTVKRTRRRHSGRRG